MSIVKVKNATNVARSVVSKAQFHRYCLAHADWYSMQTLPATALRVADTVGVAMAEEATAADMEEVVGPAARPATHAVVMAT